MNYNKKDIILIRCSTLDQEPKLQLDDINLRYTPPNDTIILQENLSAWDDKVERPILKQLEKDIASGKVNTIYVWNLDRIYRNRKRLVSFFMLCKVNKVVIKSFCQSWLDAISNVPEPFNEIFMDFLIQMLGWIAEAESDTKSSRIKMATRKKDDGTYSHKGNRWGRKKFPTNTVNRVLEFHNQGFSIRNIASNVTVYDKHNNGRNISKSAVHKIILQHKAEKHSKTPCTKIN